MKITENQLILLIKVLIDSLSLEEDAQGYFKLSRSYRQSMCNDILENQDKILEALDDKSGKINER